MLRHIYMLLLYFVIFSHQFDIMNISLNFYTHMYIFLMTGMISLFDVYGFTYDIPQKILFESFFFPILFFIYFIYLFISLIIQYFSCVGCRRIRSYIQMYPNNEITNRIENKLVIFSYIFLLYFS